MTMWINHETRVCPRCGREVSRPNYSRHVDSQACKRRAKEQHKAPEPPTWCSSQ